MIGCRTCGAVVESIADMDNICNGCGVKTDRKRSTLTRYQTQVVLLCPECTKRAETESLEAILNPTPPLPLDSPEVLHGTPLK